MRIDMKEKIFIAVMLSLLLGWAACSAEAAPKHIDYDIEHDGIYYAFGKHFVNWYSYPNNTLCVVAGDNPYTGELDIPVDVVVDDRHSYPVRGIYSLGDCPELTKISIPSSMELIHVEAFDGCSGVTDLHWAVMEDRPFTYLITDWLDDWPEEAIPHMPKSLQRVTFGQVPSIPPYFLEECSNIDELVLDQYASKIGAHSLSGPRKVSIQTSLNNGIDPLAFFASDPSKTTLRELELSPTVSEKAMRQMNVAVPSLEKLVVNNAVVPVVKFAEDNYTLKELIIEYVTRCSMSQPIQKAYGLKKIDLSKCEYMTYCDYAFYDTGIEEVILGNQSFVKHGEHWLPLIQKVSFIKNEYSVTDFHVGGLKNQSLIKEMTIPSFVSWIDDNSFENCTALETVVFEPTYVEFNTGEISGRMEIGQEAFKNCTSLKALDFQSSPLVIDAKAFENCTSLQRVSCSDDCDYLTFYGGAFIGCSALTDFTITADLIQLSNHLVGKLDANKDESVFNGCMSLKTLNLDGSRVILSENTIVGSAINTLELGPDLLEFSLDEYPESLTDIKCHAITPALFYNYPDVLPLETPTWIGDKWIFKYNDITERVTIHVPKGYADVYRDVWRSKGYNWSWFKNIVDDIDDSGSIDNLLDDQIQKDGMVEIFNLNGSKIYSGIYADAEFPCHGVYIVRTNDKSFKIIK